MTQINKKSLKDKLVVVTGAASGFGLALSKEAARQGARVVLLDINDEKLEKAKNELSQLSQIFSFHLDVSNVDEWNDVALKIKELVGVPNILINNAGVGVGGLLWEMPIASWNKVVNIDLYGVINGVHTFVPMMLNEIKKHPDFYGYIVNTASLAGYVQPSLMGIYNTCKAAVIALTETLRSDLSLVTDNIKVSVLAPFFVKTDIANEPKSDLSKLTPSQAETIKFVNIAVNTAKLTVDDVVRETYSAIRDERFYIFCNEDGELMVKNKFSSILKGEMYLSLKEIVGEKEYNRIKKMLHD